MNWIPEIDDDRLSELVGRIRPLVRPEPDGDPYYIKKVDPRSVAYTWDPSPVEKATDLVVICDVTTFHKWGYYGLFKPSIAEVLGMIPEGMTDIVVAFEIVERPETADDLNRFSIALNAGYHVARPRLYAKEQT